MFLEAQSKTKTKTEKDLVNNFISIIKMKIIIFYFKYAEEVEVKS